MNFITKVPIPLHKFEYISSVFSHSFIIWIEYVGLSNQNYENDFLLRRICFPIEEDWRRLSEADKVEKKTFSMMHGKVKDPLIVVVLYGKLFNQLSHDTTGRS